MLSLKYEEKRKSLTIFLFIIIIIIICGPFIWYRGRKESRGDISVTGFRLIFP